MDKNKIVRYSFTESSVVKVSLNSEGIQNFVFFVELFWFSKQKNDVFGWKIF